MFIQITDNKQVKSHTQKGKLCPYGNGDTDKNNSRN